MFCDIDGIVGCLTSTMEKKPAGVREYLKLRHWLRKLEMPTKLGPATQLQNKSGERTNGLSGMLTKQDITLKEFKVHSW